MSQHNTAQVTYFDLGDFNLTDEEKATLANDDDAMSDFRDLFIDALSWSDAADEAVSYWRYLQERD